MELADLILKAVNTSSIDSLAKVMGNLNETIRATFGDNALSVSQYLIAKDALAAAPQTWVGQTHKTEIMFWYLTDA